MELQQRFKKVRLFTCSQTFFTWAANNFPLHDYDKKEDEEEKEEEEEEKEEEEEGMRAQSLAKLVQLR